MNTNKNIVVSVCVQTYQHGNFIKECLDGILIQKTTFPFEVILGEDESTDGTREICKEYAKKHPDKIKLFLRSRKDVIYINGNATGRYNFIENLKACKGRYIAICEGDDYWTDSLKLQKQVDFLEANPEYVIHSGFATISTTTGKQVGRQSEKGFFTLEDFYTQNNIVTCTVMFRNIIKKFPDTFSKVKFGDWLLYTIILKHSNSRIYVANEVFSFYRIHQGGVMKSLSKLNNLNAHINQIKLLKNELKFKISSDRDIKNINNYSKEKFDIEIANYNYLDSLKTIFTNFNLVGFKMPFKHYISVYKKRMFKNK